MTKRKSTGLIANSPYCDQVEQMLRSGWGSVELSKHAADHWGQTWSPELIRVFKHRRKITTGSAIRLVPELDDDARPSVPAERLQMIALQKKRVLFTFKAEENIGLAMAQNNEAMKLLNSMINDYRADLQALGLMTVAGQKIELDAFLTPGPAAGARGYDPANWREHVTEGRLTLTQALGLGPATPEAESAAARLIYRAMKDADEKAGLRAVPPVATTESDFVDPPDRAPHRAPYARRQSDESS